MYRHVEDHNRLSPLAVTPSEDEPNELETLDLSTREGNNRLPRFSRQRTTDRQNMLDRTRLTPGWLLNCLSSLLPSFCHSPKYNPWSAVRSAHEQQIDVGTQSSTAQKQVKQSKIRHLDGLRGVACFIVFNFHFLYPWTLTAMYGYGSDPKHSFLHQLPVISLVIRGRAMVALFFAVSGYVQSHKILTMAGKRGTGRSADILQSLSSSTFRRAIRLYLPPVASMSIVLVAIRYGAFDRGALIEKGSVNGVLWLTGRREEHPQRLASWSAQKTDFFNVLSRWANPWTWDVFYNNYDPHTWTIPLELRSSMILFLTLLATYRLRRFWRMLFVSSLAMYCLRRARWEVAIFLGGALVVELDLMRQEALSNDESDEDDESASMVFSTAFSMVLGLFLLSYPDVNGKETPGYMILGSWIPQTYPENFSYLYWHSFGSLLTLWCINNTGALRRLLQSDSCQYLGRISYAFYLVQGPLLHSVGLVIMPRVWAWTGHRGNGGFVFGLLVGWTFMLAISIWTADVFWRLVDIPSTKFARWLELKTLAT